MFFIPIRIETLLQEAPWANWLFMGICIFVWLIETTGLLSNTLLVHMILMRWSPLGLVGHIFLHGGLLHLAGNMLFLWVFGNAVCGNIGNRLYLIAFLLCGVLGGLLHLILDGAPAVGASGAINGIVGFTLAMYPTNRVGVFWFFIARAGVTYIPVWVLVLLWFALDSLGIVSGGGSVAHWAHIGGLVAGLLLGLLLLQSRWIRVTQWDNPTLLDWLKGRPSVD